MFAPLAGQAEGQAQDALDLLAGVNAGIVGGVAVLAAALRTAEVHAAGQLAHAQEIGSCARSRFSAASGRPASRTRPAGAGWRTSPSDLRIRSSPCSGPHLGRRVVVVLRVADRAEQHGVGSAGKRRAFRPDTGRRSRRSRRRRPALSGS